MSTPSFLPNSLAAALRAKTLRHATRARSAVSKPNSSLGFRRIHHEHELHRHGCSLLVVQVEASNFGAWLSHSEEPRADYSVTARSRSWSGSNVRRVGRNSPPRLDRRLEFGHEPTRDTAHTSSSRFGGFWNAPPREVSAPPVFATAGRIWIDS